MCRRIVVVWLCFSGWWGGCGRLSIAGVGVCYPKFMTEEQEMENLIHCVLCQLVYRYIENENDRI